MITGKTALIITGIGIGVIVIYVFYLVLRLNCRLDTKLTSTCSNNSPNSDQKRTKRPMRPKRPKRPKRKVKKHPIATCKPGVYGDYATVLVKRLMNTAKKVTSDRGLDEKYYNQLLLAIYHKFQKLNANLINKKELEQSQKFLSEMKQEIKSYENSLKTKSSETNSSETKSEETQSEETKSEVQKGGQFKSTDLARTIKENSYAISQVYPSLK
jgi:hypothetical protein